MEALEPTETLNPPGSETLGSKTLADPQPETLAAMPPELGLEVEPPAGVTVGDFVWGKGRSHPWWPGRVCDPLEASDHVKKSPKKDGSSTLVAYFGDGSFGWCNQSQLKPFSEGFDEFAKLTSLKSFRVALDSALVEVGKILEAQLSCNCLPEEEKSELCKHLEKRVKIRDFSVEEFLGLVKDVSVDVSVVNAVEIVKLRSWVVAFERGVNVGHKRKTVSELVDKIDLDVPAAEDGDGPEILTGPGILSENNNRGRKRRSMAALIAQMDLDSVEVSDNEEDEEEKESGKDLEAESGKAGGGVKQEEVGPGRRERKKSKYLSPPYCYLSGGIAKSLGSPKSSEPKTLKSPRGLNSGSAVVKCGAGELDEEDEDDSGLSFQADGLDTLEVLSEFLATAANPLHLKRSRSAKAVRGFFSEFRCSLFSNGAKFDAYQKLGANGGFMNKEIGDQSEVSKKTEGEGETQGNVTLSGEGEILAIKSEEGKITEGKRGRKRKNIVNGEGEIPVSKSEDGKKTGSKRGRKKKDDVNVVGLIPIDLSLQVEEDKAASKTDALNEGTNGTTSVIPKQKAVNNSEDGTSGRKRGRKRKVDVSQSVNVSLGNRTVNCIELQKPAEEQTKGEDTANGKAPEELNIEGQLEVTGQKRKNNKDGSIVDIPVNLGSKVTNGSREVKSRQRKNNKNSTNPEDPAAITLTFSPGSSLPTTDELNSAFSTYGAVIQSETELLQDCNGAKVVFGRSSDAEKAFNDKLAAVDLPIANYRLRYLTGNSNPQTPIPVPKPPLPYIRKSLERMISTLSGSSLEKLAGTTSEGLKPETRDNLVGEMQGLLMKVDKMLTGPAAGTSS